MKVEMLILKDSKVQDDFIEEENLLSITDDDYDHEKLSHDKLNENEPNNIIGVKRPTYMDGCILFVQC